MPGDLDEILDRAWAAAEDGEDLGEVLELAREAIAIDERDPDANHLLGWALVAGGEFREAIPHLEIAASIVPPMAETLALLGEAKVETLDFDGARDTLRKAIAAGEKIADAHFWMGVVEERRGNDTEASRQFRLASKLDPEAFPAGFEVSEEEFHGFVEAAMAKLPEEFRAELKNLAILVEPFPSTALLEGDPPHSPTILGLHVGTSRPEKGAGRSGDLPNTIHLFQKNLERTAHRQEELVEEIETTLLHEIGHYLGLDEDEVADRGLE